MSGAATTSTYTPSLRTPTITVPFIVTGTTTVTMAAGGFNLSRMDTGTTSGASTAAYRIIQDANGSGRGDLSDPVLFSNGTSVSPGGTTSNPAPTTVPVSTGTHFLELTFSHRAGLKASYFGPCGGADTPNRAGLLAKRYDVR